MSQATGALMALGVIAGSIALGWGSRLLVDIHTRAPTPTSTPAYDLYRVADNAPAPLVETTQPVKPAPLVGMSEPVELGWDFYSNGKELVRIDSAGHVTLDPSVSNDAASRAFWKAVEKSFPGNCKH